MSMVGYLIEKNNSDHQLQNARKSLLVGLNIIMVMYYKMRDCYFFLPKLIA